MAFSRNSYKTYSTGWNVFSEFTNEQLGHAPLPVPSQVIREFIAWLSLRGLAPSTIATCVAGVGFYHELHGHSDPMKDFIVSKLLEGCNRDRRHGDARCPVTVPILSQHCLMSVILVTNSCYLKPACCAHFGGS